LPRPDHELISELAQEVGLELRGLLSAVQTDLETQQRLDQWLLQGKAGEMTYLEKGQAVMDDIREWKPWVKTIALFSLPYYRPRAGFRNGGTVARYALGRDYHNLFGKKLERLGKRLRAAGLVEQFRAATDAAPLLEREWAIRGQLGFRGKNTLVIDPKHGPWILLGELLLDSEWTEWAATKSNAGKPLATSCGTCTACLDACPTDAFDAPYSLDPRKCISYLTIEQKSGVPENLRAKMGEHVFGCEICLEVCPFGIKEDDHSETWGTHGALEQFSLAELFSLTEDKFRTAFLGSPLRRPGLEGLLRNACIALGNKNRAGDLQADERQVLKNAAEHHPKTMIQEHALWALTANVTESH